MAYEIMTKDGGGPVAKPSPVPAWQQFNKTVSPLSTMAR